MITDNGEYPDYLFEPNVVKYPNLKENMLIFQKLSDIYLVRNSKLQDFFFRKIGATLVFHPCRPIM